MVLFCDLWFRWRPAFREPSTNRYRTNPLSGEAGFTGPAIEISRRFGGTSGRFSVAQIIARLFPAYKDFVANVVREFDIPASSFPSGVYPADRLVYKSSAVVEYETPARMEGLGTHSFLQRNDSPIEGVAILIGQPAPDLLFLTLRLPPRLHHLTELIIGQVERDAAIASRN